jgi:hypothetical protein
MRICRPRPAVWPRRNLPGAPVAIEWLNFTAPIEFFSNGGVKAREEVCRLRIPQYFSHSLVYRHLMRRIWWAYPLFLLTCTPGLRQIFDWGYRTFARNRFGFSSACGLAVRSSQGSRGQ